MQAALTSQEEQGSNTGVAKLAVATACPFPQVQQDQTPLKVWEP